MPLSWSYTNESLWHGLSDKKKIIRLARSMITTGYRQDEPIKGKGKVQDKGKGKGQVLGKGKGKNGKGKGGKGKA